MIRKISITYIYALALIFCLANAVAGQTQTVSPKMSQGTNGEIIISTTNSTVPQPSKPESVKTTALTPQRTATSMTVAEFNRTKLGTSKTETPAPVATPAMESDSDSAVPGADQKAPPFKEALSIKAQPAESKIQIEAAKLTLMPVANRRATPPVPAPKTGDRSIRLDDFRTVLSFGLGMTKASGLGYNPILDTLWKFKTENKYAFAWLLFRYSPQESKGYIGTGKGYGLTVGGGPKIDISKSVTIMPKVFFVQNTQSNPDYSKTGKSFGVGSDFRITLPDQKTRITFEADVTKSIGVSVKGLGSVDEPQRNFGFGGVIQHQINSLMAISGGVKVKDTTFSQYNITHKALVFNAFTSLDLKIGR